MSRYYFVFFSIIMMSLGISSSVFGQAEPVKQDSAQRALNLTMNELLKKVKTWDFESTDGYTYHVNSDNYGFYGAQPTLYLDDIPVDVSFFGWQNINMLPVSTTDVNRLSYSSIPQVYKLADAHAGFLNLQTVRPDSGFSISGMGYFSNLIGDPGPWVYDSAKVTPNVNRWAEDLSTDVSYLARHWYAKAHFSYREHQPTTPIIYPRLVVYYPVKGIFLVKTKIKNLSADVGYHKKSWRWHARIIRSNNDDYIFYHPLGTEVPVSPFYQQLAIEGSYILNKWKIKTRFIADEKSMDYNINSRHYDFDWDQYSHKLSLSGLYKSDNVQFKTGILSKSASTQALGINDYHLNTLVLFGDAKINPDSQFTVSPAFNLDITDDEVAPTSSIDLAYDLTDSWKVSIVGTYTELLASEQQGDADWLRRGYAFVDSLNINYQDSLNERGNQLIKLKLKSKFNISKKVKLDLYAEYLHHLRLGIPWQTFSYSSSYGIPTDPGTYRYTSEEGRRVSFNASLHYNINRFLRQRISGTAQYTLSGSERYKSYWEQVPKYKLNYNITYQVIPDLSFSLDMMYHNSSRWKEYANLDGKEYRSVEPFYPRRYHSFHSKTPSYFDVDLRLQKWFWNRRLSTTFAIQNLFNSEVRTHPLGSNKGFRFDIKAALQF